MSSIILTAVLVSLWCNGLKIVTSKGYAFHFVEKFLNDVFITHPVTAQEPKISQFYYPILYCVICMSSLHGFIVSLLVLPVDFRLFYEIPMVMVCACAISAIISPYIFTEE